MPSYDQFVHQLLELPEVRGLQSCAQRLRVRFAIRGGVLRNLLFNYESLRSNGSSLYDLVDPFSDIDLVVETPSDWSSIAAAITESIPFASFHRWEAETEEAVRATSKRFHTIPADRLLAWFDGTKELPPRVQLEGLDVELRSLIEMPAIQIEQDLKAQRGDLRPFDRLLDVLRVSRYLLSFEHIPRIIEAPELLDSFPFKNLQELDPTPRGMQQFRDMRRLELAILDLVFTARRWKPIQEVLQVCRQHIPSIWLESSLLLSRIFYKSGLDAGSGVGALLYKPSTTSALRSVLFDDSRKTPERLRGISTVIPWTKVRSGGHNPSDCCNYTDFQNGVATVVWRGKENDLDFAKLSPSRFATAAAPLPSRAAYAQTQRELDQTVIPIPGFVRSGPALVLRIDHGYVRAFMNRNVSFYLGLLPSEVG